ncbi:hypothetical protein [uncultured Tenacibaculum sp.]|uniref:hypothetical protein n=1 Tax=uncultured Tenacibaculum sp. TaxID=174713 RepID=UPI00260E34B7|nr:hypothetical protein [uncultured Tenacibaculum sp.]
MSIERSILILYILLFNNVHLNAQENKETIYLSFNEHSKEKYVIEDGIGNDLLIKKYRKKRKGNRTIFYIGEESFVLDKKNKIDTCNIKYLNKIKFETLKSIEKKRVKEMNTNFFKNTVFKKIYLIEKQKDKIIKYPVLWTTSFTEK